ncbi:MAG: amidohydrolase family protein [Synergistaceae bacterium]|jgi:predicted TIM-barrel fold metal-dependent hydrolase|nr:amidohydrolase family protein [Synergistaceae bacterium]
MVTGLFDIQSTGCGSEEVIAMIVDTHVHVYPPEVRENWRSIALREPCFGDEVTGRVHRWASADDVLAAMEADGVDESWICGFAFTDLGLCRLCNDYVLECAESSEGKLKPIIAVPPLARGACDEIARCAELGAIGVGELLPDGQRFRVEDIDETWRFAAECHERGLFVLLHVAEPVGRNYPGKGKSGPREAYLFAQNHPELCIVMAHCGGGLFLYEQMPDARVTLQNVWYDTAAAPFVYNSSILNSVIASGTSEKFLYGSDFPILRLPRYKKMIEESALVDKDLEGLFFVNARRLESAAEVCFDPAWTGWAE